MRPLQYKSRSDGYSNSNGKNRNFDITTDEIDNRKIITLANNHSNLKSVIQKFGVALQSCASSSGWTYRAPCPFLSHKGGKEKNASFGYHPKDDRFNCFGCGASGRSVEFISKMDGRPSIEIARYILSIAGLSESDARVVEDDSNEKINALLFDFAATVSKIIDFNRDDKFKLDIIDRNLFCVDMYINCAVHNTSLNVDEFEQRLKRYKETLTRLGDE
jgi:hypothetical protein